MSSQFLLGSSVLPDAKDAGVQAAKIAAQQLGSVAPSVIIIFASALYDQKALLSGIRSVFKDTPFVGCSGEGMITATGSEEGRYFVVLMVVASDNIRAETYCAGGLKSNSAKCGEELAQKINKDMMSKHKDAKALFLFPDGLTVNSTLLLSNLQQNLAKPLTILGGTAGENLQMTKTYQYCNDAVLEDGVAAVLFCGDFNVEVAVSHGCEPIGKELTVTKADKNTVQELDGRSPWQVVREYLGEDIEDFQASEFVHIGIGHRLDDDQIEASGIDSIIRMPMAHNKGDGSLVFPAEIAVGRRVQIFRRDAEQIIVHAKKTVQRIVDKNAGRKPAAVFQFDCAGRGKLFFGVRASSLVVQPLQQVLGHDVPWIGFHTYGEIAPVGDKAEFHNYTVVLCVFYDN